MKWINRLLRLSEKIFGREVFDRGTVDLSFIKSYEAVLKEMLTNNRS